MPRNAGTSQAFWDSFSEHYDAFQQGDSPGRVVDLLLKRGALCPGYSVLDVGAGPGTYTRELARRVRHVTALDVSESMTRSNKEVCESLGMDNVSFRMCNWHSDCSLDIHDSCISAFMPLGDSLDSMMRMERHSRESCIVISWAVNNGEIVTEAIKKELGIDWPHRSHDRAYERLKSVGREARHVTMDVHICSDIPKDRIVLKETSRFESAGFEVGTTVCDVVDEMCQHDIFHAEYDNVIGITYWHPDRNL